MVWGWLQTTILPPTPRPGYRPPRGSCRSSARHDEAYNDRNFDSNNEANDDRFNFSSNVAGNVWFSDRLRLRFRLSFSPGFGYRRSCGRSSLHGERYLGRHFVTCFAGCVVRSNRAFSSRYQLPGGSFQLSDVLGTRPARRQGTAPLSRSCSASGPLTPTRFLKRKEKRT